MPPYLALLIAAIFVLFAFRFDRKHNAYTSKALVWPTLWYLVTASHPFGVWLQMWGFPIPGGSNDPTEGSSIDRYFYGGLTVIGLWILSRRRFDWGATFRRNSWLTTFIAFMALSILWSHYPFVSFKRFIKVIGSIVMACVILTEDDPLAAFSTVLRRCLYIHLPMSIICIKYFRNIGVSFDWFGTAESWQGISTTKNVLGQVAMLGVVYFFWEVRRHWREYRWRNIYLPYLFMAVYLLKGSEQDVSMTSISVCVFALVIFLRMQALRSRPEFVRPFVMKVLYAVAGLISLVLIHSVVLFSADSIFGHLITLLGRDITLTDRTYIWSDVYAAAAGNPLLGVGFGGFWIGRMANIPWNAHMTWVLGQAHSGYVDTYLQLGFVGAFLLAGVIFSTVPRLIDSMDEDFDFGCFRITLFLTILFVNMTESVYLRGDHHLWLILMIVLWSVPSRAEATEAQFVVVNEDHHVKDVPSLI
jgi:exopolysaccharide production protein ExoQ